MKKLMVFILLAGLVVAPALVFADQGTSASGSGQGFWEREKERSGAAGFSGFNLKQFFKNQSDKYKARQQGKAE